VRSGTICEFKGGKEAVESILRNPGPFVMSSSSGEVTMMVIGIEVDLSNNVEELEKEDFRVLVAGVFSGDTERKDSVGESRRVTMVVTTGFKGGSRAYGEDGMASIQPFLTLSYRSVLVFSR